LDTHLTPHFIDYYTTGKFSKIVTDYISHDASLKEFYNHVPTLEGIKSAIEEKKQVPVNREVLVRCLTRQYESLNPSEKVLKNIQLLLKENTFSICTAHQPNIFTGHLYFIYKIMHVIRLADVLSKELSAYHFVPVFFIGSEDADIEELNHIELERQEYTWNTKQTGAVGRMIIDKDFLALIQSFEGRIKAEHHGTEVMEMVREAYTKGRTIQDATLHFVHSLFADFGLVAIIADDPAFKKEMFEIFKNDLFEHEPAQIVNETSKRIAEIHHAQAFARDINLFYMKDNLRNRIVFSENKFVVHDTDISFTKETLLKELDEHPERFSPNVILRGLFQETILPDIAFVGGGGELAYWLQLKDLFNHFNVPYPVLFLRNSFLIIQKKWKDILDKNNLTNEDIFRDKEKLITGIVQKNSKHNLDLSAEKATLENFFDTLAEKTSKVDVTLKEHVQALKARQLKNLAAIQNKMVAAEKKNMDATVRQINKVMLALHSDGLQERTENFMLFYALWGKDFLQNIYAFSSTWDPKFCILTEM